MKCTFYYRLLCMAAFCLLFSTLGFAQKNNRESGVKVSAADTRAAKQARAQRMAQKSLPAQNQVFGLACDDDQTAPEIQCQAGNCLPSARAAYLISQYGEPWQRYDNIYAMNAVFGSGNWDALIFENADVASLLSPAYKMIFLEGSDAGGYSLDAFLMQNLTALENWVAAGGALFINAAANNTPQTINFGFGGVTLNCFRYSYEGYVQDPGHPIFNGPFVPAYGNFTGNYFQLASLTGDVGASLIIGANGADISLSVKNWGNGKVYFGGVAIPSWDGPHPNVDNMWQNILADLNAHCNAGLVVSADAGACTASVLDQSLDATATDDCVLASLTHDFAAAPSNTTLNGAVLPTGNTLVRWTAIDAAGNSSTCETLLSVRESEAPVITCPSDLSVSVDLGTCGALVNFNVAATDNCTAAPNVTSLPASGATFPVGSTTVIATATDESYNASTCAFVVTVVPNPEICNGLDDDCNGWIDDGATGDATVYRDNDGDGYGDSNNSITASCPIPYGYVFNALDCDDNNYYIQPGMYESCNGVDDNCDGQIDEGVAPTWFADTDGDGYGDPNTSQNACNQPQGFVSNNLDCTDTDAYIHPGALEDCTNLVDENCDGILGENNFVIAETHTDVFCGSNPDGLISITVTPAQNYPVVLWSNGTCCTTDLSNLDFGTYKVTVTNECGTSKTKTVVVGPPAEPALQVSLIGTDYICGGASDGSITATPADGCGGYSFEWSNGSTDASISGQTGGIYTVVVTDACGCTRSGTFTINQPEQLSLYFATVIPLLDGTYFVQVLPYGGRSPFQFRRSTPPTGFTAWSASNGFMSVTPGDYVFEVQDAGGCTAQAEISLALFTPRPLNAQDGEVQGTNLVATDNRASSAAELMPLMEKAWAVSLFPNPNTGNFKIDLQQPAASQMSFGITDQSGRLLLEKQVEPDSQIQTVNAETLPSGLYFLQVVAGGKVVAVEKFVKE